jgi:hypothetical protein
VFDGLSGKLSDGHPGHGIENAQFDASLDIERGSYSFSTGGGVGTIQAVCAGVFAGEPEIDLNAQIISNGFYDNIICGTGFAHDLDGDNTIIGGVTDTPNVPPVLDGGEAYTLGNIGYEVPFIDRDGPLLIGPDGKIPLAGLTEAGIWPFGNDTHAPLHGADGVAGGPFSAQHGLVDSDYTGRGDVHITPRSPDNCFNAFAEDGVFNDTDEFLVSGHFTITDAP